MELLLLFVIFKGFPVCGLKLAHVGCILVPSFQWEWKVGSWSSLKNARHILHFDHFQFRNSHKFILSSQISKLSQISSFINILLLPCCTIFFRVCTNTDFKTRKNKTSFTVIVRVLQRNLTSPSPNEGPPVVENLVQGSIQAPVRGVLTAQDARNANQVPPILSRKDQIRAFFPNNRPSIAIIAVLIVPKQKCRVEGEVRPRRPKLQSNASLRRCGREWLRWKRRINCRKPRFKPPRSPENRANVENMWPKSP